MYKYTILYEYKDFRDLKYYTTIHGNFRVTGAPNTTAAMNDFTKWAFENERALCGIRRIERTPLVDPNIV